MTDGPDGLEGALSEADAGTITVERRDPGEAFALLGDETRVSILRTLDEAPEDVLTFSDLRERVGTADSGQFNYHLRKLVGSFVRREDDGYTLTLAGGRIVGALVAGTYTATVSLDPIAVDAPCPECGGPLVLEYEDELMHVHCTDCERFRHQFAFPPGTLDQFEPAELPAAADRWLRSTFQRIVAGFCTNCGGRVDGDLDVDGEDPIVRYECRRCDSESHGSPSTVALFHPAGIGFFYDHGIDVTETPTWEAFGRLDAFEVEAVGSDDGDGVEGEKRGEGDGSDGSDGDDRGRPAARVTLELDGDRLVATVDADGRVASVERTKRGSTANT